MIHTIISPPFSSVFIFISLVTTIFFILFSNGFTTSKSGLSIFVGFFSVIALYVITIFVHTGNTSETVNNIMGVKLGSNISSYDVVKVECEYCNRYLLLGTDNKDVTLKIVADNNGVIYKVNAEISSPNDEDIYTLSKYLIDGLFNKYKKKKSIFENVYSDGQNTIEIEMHRTWLIISLYTNKSVLELKKSEELYLEREMLEKNIRNEDIVNQIL